MASVEDEDVVSGRCSAARGLVGACWDLPLAEVAPKNIRRRDRRRILLRGLEMVSGPSIGVVWCDSGSSWTSQLEDQDAFQAEAKASS
jgi:hypothetical protein